MSDYLWDKSGEPEAEVERLEEVLKELRYQPRELKLPETTVAAAPPIVQPGRRRYWPALAAAASLLLMGIAGLWLGQHRINGPAAPTPNLAGNRPVQEPTRAIQAEIAPAPVNIEPAKASDRHAQAAKRVPHTLRPHRTRPEVGDGSSLKQELADERAARRLEQERVEALRAKEELMLALQVASSRLNRAQRRTQTGSDADVRPSAPASNNME